MEQTRVLFMQPSGSVMINDEAKTRLQETIDKMAKGEVEISLQ